MAGSSQRTRGRSVTSKTASILSAFSSGARDLSLNELARRTGLPVSTTYRLALELVEWGALERAPGGGFRIGLKLWEVGSLAPRSATLQEIVLPYMQDLYAATNENVHLAVLAGTEALYVERVTGHRSIPVKSRRAGRMPLHATGVGKVLLAYGGDALFESVVAVGLRRYTPYTIVAPGHLREALEEIRRTGVAFANEEITIGTLSVAAPLPAKDGGALAALSIVVRSVGADLRWLAPAVRTAALSAAREVHRQASMREAQL